MTQLKKRGSKTCFLARVKVAEARSAESRRYASALFESYRLHPKNIINSAFPIVRALFTDTESERAFIGSLPVRSRFLVCLVVLYFFFMSFLGNKTFQHLDWVCAVRRRTPLGHFIHFGFLKYYFHLSINLKSERIIGSSPFPQIYITTGKRNYFVLQKRLPFGEIFDSEVADAV